MPAATSAAGKVSRLNCGLWRERGTVRTSMSRATEWAFINAMNSPSGRVEWPTVSTTSSESTVATICVNSGSALNQRVDPFAQHRHELPLKPGMMLEPRLVTRRWVGQRHVLRSVRLPGPDRCGQRWLAAVAQKVALGILPDEQSQFNPGQPGQQLVEP